MKNITTIVSGLKTILQNLTWTSPSGTGTTSISAIYDYPNYEHVDGYPFVVINDRGEDGETLDTRSFEVDYTIEIEICSNWTVVNKSTDHEKRQEAVLRIREATDILKRTLVLKSTKTSLGVDHIYQPGYDDIVYNDTLKIYMRTFRVLIKDTIDNV
jgi:hypothetical protein